MATLNERSRLHQIVIDPNDGRVIVTTVHEIVRDDAGRETIIANSHEHVTLAPGEFDKAHELVPAMDAVFKAVWTDDIINGSRQKLETEIEMARKKAADEAEADIRRRAAAEAANAIATEAAAKDAASQHTGP